MHIDLNRTADRLLIFGIGALLLTWNLGDLLSGRSQGAVATIVDVAGVVVAALFIVIVAVATIRNPRGRRKRQPAP